MSQPPDDSPASVHLPRGDRNGQYDCAVDALVTAVEQFIRLGAIKDPAVFVRDVARQLTARFPASDIQTNASAAIPTNDADDRVAEGDERANHGSSLTERQETEERLRTAQPVAPTHLPLGTDPIEQSQPLPLIPTKVGRELSAATTARTGGATPFPKKPRASKPAVAEIAKLANAVRQVSPNVIQAESPMPPPAARAEPLYVEPAPESQEPVMLSADLLVPSTTVSQGHIIDSAGIALTLSGIEQSPVVDSSPADVLQLEMIADSVSARSNVRPVSNVHLRNKDVSAQSDAPFRKQIRGLGWIKDIYAAAGILTRSDSVGSQDLTSLSPRQRDEVKDFTCLRNCGRREYGYIRLPDGKLKWGSLSQHGRLCLCHPDRKRVDAPVSMAALAE